MTESELRRAVQASLEGDDAELGLVLQQVVLERLGDVWDLDRRYVTLDGLKVLSIEVEAARLRLRGAFYLLEGDGHRMLPVEADLSVQPGEDSVVRVADGTFELPASERQFRRGMENVRWAHSVTLRLA